MRLMLALLVMLTLAPGCATIRNEDFKDVSFTSEPTNAVVTLDGEVIGTTPVTVQIKRAGRDKVLTFTKDGYKSLVLTLDRKVDRKTFFGGLIGLSLDAMTGRAGTYVDELHVTLEAGEGSVEIHSKDLELTDEEKEQQLRDAEPQTGGPVPVAEE